MHLFYSTELKGNRFSFDRDESRHLSKVLRLAKGSIINVIDGSGTLYECSVVISDPKLSVAEIFDRKIGYDKRNYYLHIAIAPTKNIDRFEWFVEKSVEIGIDEITPIICINSERRKVNTDRLERIVISAMKQSVKATPTKINEPVDFKQFLGEKIKGKSLIATCNESIDRTGISESFIPGENLNILIGPEGDFSLEELNWAFGKRISPIHLGPAKLRTETAGITACCSVYLINM